MAKCPVCDYPSGDIQALLERISDPGLLIGLACDFAERVVEMAPDPAQAMAWLQATRLWAASPDALKKIQEDARQVAIKTVWSDAKAARAAWSAVRAVAAATRVVMTDTGQAQAEEAEEAAGEAFDAVIDAPERERAWQLEHTRTLACTCPLSPDAAPPGPRNRRSLLAQ